MNPERFAIAAGTVAILALLVLSALGYMNGYDSRLAAVERELAEVKPDRGAPAAAGAADSAELRDRVVGRTDLWGPLIPEPKVAAPPPPQAFDLAQALQGVAVLPGGIGSGDGARVRIATPGNPQGAWFSKGDTVISTAEGAVLIEGITADAVTVGMTHNGTPIQHRLRRP